MALAEIDTNNPFFAALAVDGRQEAHQVPADPKVCAGIAVRDLGALTLFEVQGRIVEAFQSLEQTDSPKAVGECIAYTFLDEDEESRFDATLIEDVTGLMGGSAASDAAWDTFDGTAAPLWEGFDAKHAYQLSKAASFIILEDGAMPQGTIYRLFGVSR